MHLVLFTLYCLYWKLFKIAFYTFRVVVQRPAPPEAPLRPFDFTGGSGARFDKCGNIVPYSILGTVEDYKTEAFKSGDIPEVLANETSKMGYSWNELIQNQ